MSNAREIAQLGSAPSGRRNLIINGAMNVAQRGTSFTGWQDTSGYCLDRFKYSNYQAGTVSITQDSDAPDGFSKSLKISTTATGGTSGTYSFLQQFIEGQDVAQLAYGTSSPKQITISFWVKSNMTGTYTINISTYDSARRIASTYQVNSANTWEYKTITFIGEYNSTIAYNNTLGLAVEWWFAAGSSFATNPLPTTWTANSNLSRSTGITVGINTSTSNYVNITGVQLEVGSVATEFEHRSYGEELALCQRYYCQFPHDITSDFTAFPMWVYSSGGASTRVLLPVTMRTSPSITLDGTITTGTPGASDIGVYSNAAWRNGAGQGLGFLEIDQSSFRIDYNRSGAFTSGYSAGFYIYNNGTETNRIQINAEL